MKRLILLVAALLLLAFPVPVHAKPKLIVQLVGQNVIPVTKTMHVIEVYVVMPDGGHVKGECLWVMSPDVHTCLVEPVAVEKRVVVDCNAKGPTRCFLNEVYYADRKANDLTVHAGNGKVTYHITGAW